MNAEEFWRDDPQLFVSYRTSFINKKKREMEEIDYKSWLQGAYIYDGNNRIGARIQQTIANGFNGFAEHPHPDKTDFGNYPKRPYSEETSEKKEERKKNKYQEYQNSLSYFGSIKEIYLKQKESGK